MTEKRYVLGFYYIKHEDMLLLIKKRSDCPVKPVRGLLNGIGGKVEPGETPIEAMGREFREETGILFAEDWKPVIQMAGKGWRVYVFCSQGWERPRRFETREGRLALVRPDDLPLDSCVPNLSWLVPMCFDGEILQEQVEVEPFTYGRACLEASA